VATHAVSRTARRVVVTSLASMALVANPVEGQDVSGRWVYEESGQLVQLDVRHDRATNRIAGTFSLFGNGAAFEGTFRGGSLVIERLGDVRTSAENGTMTGKLQGSTLIFTIVQPGQAPVTMPMTRRAGAPPAAPGGSEPPASGTSGGAALASAGSGYRAGTARDFTGRWEFASDDGTNQEILELSVSGTAASGTLTALEHGYFSRRTTVKAEVAIRGTLSGGTLQVRLWDAANGSPNDAVAGTARLRGEYLVLRLRDTETGYARPGRALVQSAEGSAEAAALARAITGRVYATSSQASGRGAFVGGRVRLALCGDGRIEYDASDVGSTPSPSGGSVDMGSSVARRGRWGIVLHAGAPMVRAEWEGTGTSYSLTAYFRVEPDAGGQSATVDGVVRRVAGRC
jgi:hypothetical protein